MSIGKYVLESITTGMYVHSLDVLREYIQNAADAIDQALRDGILHHEKGLIYVLVDPANKYIAIEDNGVGVAFDNACKTLSDVGNSTKINGRERGFRGIGRLSGLSYCDRLTFVTTAAGEAIATEVSLDALALRTLLAAPDYNDTTAEEVMARILVTRTVPAVNAAHFFRVIMEGVSPESGLLNVDVIARHITQCAPIDFDDTRFSWANVIRQEIPVTCYTLRIISPMGEQVLHKPYTDTFLINRSTGETDTIRGIEFEPLKDVEGRPIGMLWYGISDFRGSVADHDIKGLRMRVGNILLGDGQSLCRIFKDRRFNGWVIGEAVIQDGNGLIPNARRDDFEHNAVYYRLEEQLRTIATKITQRIRAVSIARNRALSDAADKADEAIRRVEHAFTEERVSPARKGAITSQLEDARAALTRSPSTPNDESFRQDALERLDLVTDRFRGTTQFRALNILNNLTRNEKNLLARIFLDLLAQYDVNDAQACIDRILEVLGKTSGITSTS